MDQQENETSMVNEKKVDNKTDGIELTNQTGTDQYGSMENGKTNPSFTSF